MKFTKCIKTKGSRDQYPLCLCRGGLSSVGRFQHRISDFGGLRVPHGSSNAVKRKLILALHSLGFWLITYSSSPTKEINHYMVEKAAAFWPQSKDGHRLTDFMDA